MATILTVAGHRPQIAHDAYLAPGVTVAGAVTLSAGTSVWFGSVLRSEDAGITVGRDSNLQDLTVVHTDLGAPVVIGARVTVGHRAILHGCTIDDDVLIGMGAIVLNGARIGAGAVVAAGAVVREGMHIPPMTLAVGVPATVREDVTLPEIPRSNVTAYLDLAAAYGDAQPTDGRDNA